VSSFGLFEVVQGFQGYVAYEFGQRVIVSVVGICMKFTCLADPGMYACMMKTNESEAVRVFRFQPVVGWRRDKGLSSLLARRNGEQS
jgi:hypothetical protein